MSDQDKASKTEAPTSKRLNEAFQKGDFAKAPEVAAAFTLAAAFGVFAFVIPEKADTLRELAKRLFGGLHQLEVNRETTAEALTGFISSGMAFLAPLFAAVMFAGLAAGGLQTGFRISPKAIEPKLNKLNPINGAQNLLNGKKMVQFLVDLMKFAAVGAVLYGVIGNILHDPVFYTVVTPSHLAKFIFETFMVMLVNLVLAISAIAAAHLAWQKKSKMDDLKMTKQEVKDEMKSAEGDPQVKNQRRQLARRLLERRMLDAVPMADVVVTNPTHFAIALRYDRNEDEAPIVLAKGTQRLARRMKAVAKAHGVPMVENKPVARILYQIAAVDEPIPAQLYQVIAEILGHVYKTHRHYFYELKRRREAANRAAA